MWFPIEFPYLLKLYLKLYNQINEYCFMKRGRVLILIGKLVKGTKILKEAVAENNEEGFSYRDTLEKCLIDLCKKLDIPVPLWLKKNTTEFVSFRRTFFTSEQFIDKVSFDRFEIKVEG